MANNRNSATIMPVAENKRARSRAVGIRVSFMGGTLGCDVIDIDEPRRGAAVCAAESPIGWVEATLRSVGG